MEKIQCTKSCPFLCREGIDLGKFNPVLPDGPVGRILAIGEAPGAKEIGKISLKIAANIFLNLENLKKNRLA